MFQVALANKDQEISDLRQKVSRLEEIVLNSKMLKKEIEDEKKREEEEAKKAEEERLKKEEIAR